MSEFEGGRRFGWVCWVAVGLALGYYLGLIEPDPLRREYPLAWAMFAGMLGFAIGIFVEVGIEVLWPKRRSGG